MNQIIRAIIVDDEVHARRRIADLLASDPAVSVIHEASDGLMAVEKITSQRPDMVFLDIQMPTPDGFGVLKEIPGDIMPYIIFVTAYHEYAIKAFEVNALDYLLKPYTEERFFESLEKAKKTIFSNRKAEVMEKIYSLQNLDFSLLAKQYSNRIPVKADGKVHLVAIDKIHFIEADGNYVHLQTDDSYFTIRNLLNTYEEALDPSKFFRVHRSVIVNVSKIQDLQHWSKGEYLITMPGNKRFTSSRTYRENIEKLLRIG